MSAASLKELLQAVDVIIFISWFWVPEFDYEFNKDGLLGIEEYKDAHEKD